MRESPSASTGRKDKKEPLSSLRWWFAAGFSLVFLGMLLCVQKYQIAPSSESVIACPLWQCYFSEVRHALSSSDERRLGIMSDTAMTFVQHVLCAVAGGMALLGMKYMFRKSSH
jgi:hypothetical protein